MPTDGLSICVDSSETWYTGHRLGGLEDLDEIHDIAALEQYVDSAREEYERRDPDRPWPPALKRPLYMEEFVQYFDDYGLTVVEADCDLSLVADIAGVPLLGAYHRTTSGAPSGSAMYFYDGALVVGTVRLEAPGQEALVGEVYGLEQGRQYRDVRITTGAEQDASNVDYTKIARSPLFRDWIFMKQYQ